MTAKEEATSDPSPCPLPAGEGWRCGCQRTTLAGSWTLYESAEMFPCPHAHGDPKDIARGAANRAVHPAKKRQGQATPPDCPLPAGEGYPLPHMKCSKSLPLIRPKPQSRRSRRGRPQASLATSFG